MHSLSPDERRKIHAVYVAIYRLPFTLQRKTTLLTALMGGAEWSWRVVGITPGALEVLEANSYKYVKGKICRAHKVARYATAGAVFGNAQPLLEDDFFTKYWANDETIIATKSENKTGGTLPAAIPIDYRSGMFPCNTVVGWKHTKKEAAFLRELHANYKAGRIVPKDPTAEPAE